MARAARETVDSLLRRGLLAVTAESCTGGLVAGALTAVPGSSAVLHGGFVTYSNAAKTEMLGVPKATIAFVGAVSQAVAGAMAAGARGRTGASIAVSVTGIAGPGGGSADKPVGTVWFGVEDADGARQETRLFAGDRDAIRRSSVLQALGMLRTGSGLGLGSGSGSGGGGA